MRFIQSAFILILACSINSCTLVKTAYNNAPEALSWWLDDYFDFNRSQNAVLDPALHRLHDWHRQQQLPAYIQTLQDLQTAISKPQITADLACEKLDDIKASFVQLQLQSIPIIIEVAPLLTDNQLQYLRTKLDERAIKWKSEWWQDSAEEQLAVRLEKMEDFSEKIYGNLNASQQEILKRRLSEKPFKPELGYAEILRRHDDVEQIVSSLQRSTLNTEDKSQLIKAGFERLQNSPNAEYQTYANYHKQNVCSMISELHASTDNEQKQHAKEWLENYIVQFTSLAQVKSGSN